MIRIFLYRAQGKLRAYSIRGHAGAAAYGNDVVCAAVSVLSQAIANGLMAEEVPLAYSLSDGRLDVCVRPRTPKQQRAADVLLNTLYIALAEIAARHTKHVLLKERNGGDNP